MYPATGEHPVMNAPYAVFARQLRDLRRTKNLTQEEAGKRVGVTGSTWSRWELGQNLPGPEHLRKLADAFPSFKGDTRSYLGRVREAVDRDRLAHRLRNATKDEAVTYGTNVGSHKVELLVDGSLRVTTADGTVLVLTDSGTGVADK